MTWTNSMKILKYQYFKATTNEKFDLC